jgi:hypothetical protein
MFKLLVWGLVGYVIYRYFQTKFGLINRNQDNIHSPEDNYQNTSQDKRAGKKDEDGDFIDYEEIR